MKKQIVILFLLSFLLIFSFCRKEQKFPMILTGAVSDIDSTGAVFHGNITSLGSQEIIDYGFVWDLKSSPIVEDSYKKSLGVPSEENTFSEKISTDFFVGKEYNVRAYVEIKGSVFYGNVISFISLGINSPQIENFEPQNATWGDKIIINGHNFSLKSEENLLKFGNFQANIIESNETMIVATVPSDLETTQCVVSVSCYGNKATSKQNFKLLPPIISEISPQSGTWPETVTIKGNYFHPKFTIVEFDARIASVNYVNSTEIEVIIPYELPRGETDLCITKPKIFNIR